MKEDCLNGGLLAKGLALFDNLVLPTPVILYRKVPSTYIYIIYIYIEIYTVHKNTHDIAPQYGYHIIQKNPRGVGFC